MTEINAEVEGNEILPSMFPTYAGLRAAFLYPSSVLTGDGAPVHYRFSNGIRSPAEYCFYDRPNYSGCLNPIASTHAFSVSQYPQAEEGPNALILICRPPTADQRLSLPSE